MKRIFGLDLRSLAVYRIGLALIIICDLIVRATDLTAFYTDFGLLPRAPLVGQFLDKWFFSIHLMNGEIFFQSVLFLVAGAFAMLMLVGYRTKMATIVSWFLLISLQNRNPMILQGGDVLLRLLMFWAMFLPLGEYLSFDSLSRSDNDRPVKFFGIATVAVFVQIALLYWFIALHRSLLVWWTDATAVYYALEIDQFTRGFGYFLLRFPNLLKFLTRSVSAFEVFLPIMLIAPFWTEYLRLAAVTGAVLLHFGLGISMHLGPFPWVNTVSMLPFLPALFWDKIFSFSRRGGSVSVRAHTILDIVAGFFIVYVIFWNLSTIPKFGRPMPESLKSIGLILRLDQDWNMFAPSPMTEDGWYVIPAVLRNGEEVDLFHGGKEVTYDKPDYVSSTYNNERWRKYMMNIWAAANSKYRLYYGQYLCRDWNSRHSGDQVLETFEVIYMREDTLPDYEISTPEKVVIWRHDCFAKN